MFLQNVWYVAAWDHEIDGQPFARTICGEPVLLYRRFDRGLVALEDCCPHRLMPLSKGSVRDDKIVCGYHGATFDGTGACVAIPGGGGIPPWAEVKTYPVAERHRFVWVWIGDPKLASPDKIPDVGFCNDPDWAFDGSTYHVDCNYVFVVDNLMDLTHETYVHPTSIGQPEIEEAPLEAVSDERTVTLSRYMFGIEPPPVYKRRLMLTGLVDRWQVCRFSLPSTVLIDVGVAPQGTTDIKTNRPKGLNTIIVNLITPETETSCWYHWGNARDYQIDNRSMTATNRQVQGRVFLEDVAVLEAQQKNILRRPDRPLRNFKFDQGSVYARRLIDAKLAAQAG